MGQRDQEWGQRDQEWDIGTMCGTGGREVGPGWDRRTRDGKVGTVEG